ncbi:MAG: efflux RND transporter permease subunit [Gemmataceae bacterium]
MIDWLIAFSIRRRGWIFLAAVLMVVWGIRAIARTPIDAIPDLSDHHLVVVTEWPGHGPTEIDERVSQPLSSLLEPMPGVRVVRASSDVGFAMHTVVLNDGVSESATRNTIAETLKRQTNWPDGVRPALAPDAAATGQIVWYTVEGKGLNPAQLRTIQDEVIKPALSAIPGVAEVASVGGRVVEKHVEIEPRFLVDGARSLPSLIESIRQNRDPTIPTSNSLGSAPRRGVFEKDGGEATGSVVLMARGENPRVVTKRIMKGIVEVESRLPHGVRIVPIYDRTPLIDSVIGTVSGTLIEAIITATICIVVILRHLRTAFVLAITLPLAVLFSFGLVDFLRQTGLVEVETNLMSLAGLAISIGVLVDSSIVMAENAMHHLKRSFGDRPVTGNTSSLVLAACREVGRPIAGSVFIMLFSFLPVFALDGMEGKMFHPLAFTKSFALLGVGILSLTLVPALCTVFVRGRLKSEDDVSLVRGLSQVYRPVLAYLMDRPAVAVGIVAVTVILGSALIGHDWFLRIVTVASAIGVTIFIGPFFRKAVVFLALIGLGLTASVWLTPLPREFLSPLDEGMVMDMPISVPRISASQAADDLLARDMILCRFPEVAMVVGKAGRAETASDPAPLDMIETMIEFRPVEFWPHRTLTTHDIEKQAMAVVKAMVAKQIIAEPTELTTFTNTVAMAAVVQFDAQLREAAYQKNKAFERDLGRILIRRIVDNVLSKLADARPDLAPMLESSLSAHTAHFGMTPTYVSVAAVVRDTIHHLHEHERTLSTTTLPPDIRLRAENTIRSICGFDETTVIESILDDVKREYTRRWRQHVSQLNADLLERAAPLYTRLVIEAALKEGQVRNANVIRAMHDWHRIRATANESTNGASNGHHHGGTLPFLDPVPELDSIQSRLSDSFAASLLLWPRERKELSGFGGELDRALPMPGWQNIWTMPIQNRVDMLATGVNTAVGVRVLGPNLDDLVSASEAVASKIKTIPGAADVITDPIRGRIHREIVPKAEAFAKAKVDPQAWKDLVELIQGETVIAGAAGQPAIRIMLDRTTRTDLDAIRQLPVATTDPRKFVPFHSVAEVRMVEGPASVKREKGSLRNYVRLNVRGRDATEFVNDAKRILSESVTQPPGVTIEWTGQFEHQARARQTLMVTIPLVLVTIFAVLWWTVRDAAEAGLMMLTIPGALSGGLFLIAFFGSSLSVGSWIGLISCFGMATSTGIIMLVYLRQSVANAEGKQALTRETLRSAVLDGAVKRLRPKLLTEATTLFGLAPLLLASGPGSDVLKPMAIPVLGGLLIADEVIDLFLPVLFYQLRCFRMRKSATRT